MVQSHQRDRPLGERLGGAPGPDGSRPALRGARNSAEIGRADAVEALTGPTPPEAIPAAIYSILMYFFVSLLYVGVRLTARDK